MYPLWGFAQAPLSSHPSDEFLLSSLPFGPKALTHVTFFGFQPEGSLAMCPLVGFASQAQGYVSKEQRVLSDAPSGQFSEPLARRLPGICGGIFPSVSF